MEFKTKPSDSPRTVHMGMLPAGPTLPMGLILPMCRTLPMSPNTYCKQNHQHGLVSSLLADVYFSPLENGEVALSLDILETAMLSPTQFQQKRNLATVL